MIDVVDRATRSRMMAGIRSADTRPELQLRRALHALGLRYRLHVAGLAGRPDIVLPRWRAVLFVHGCFWHRHRGCSLAATPKTRPDFWQAKFEANIDRDRRSLVTLSEAGWRTIVVWECGLRTAGAGAVARRCLETLESDESSCEIGRVEMEER